MTRKTVVQQQVILNAGNGEIAWKNVATLPDGDVRKFLAWLLDNAEKGERYQPATIPDLVYEIEEEIKKHVITKEK